MSDTESDKGVVLTTSIMLKWGGFLGMAIGGLGTLIVWGASVGAEQKAALARDVQMAGELSDLKSRVKDSEKSFTDLRIDMARAVALLERIEGQLKAQSQQNPK